MVLFITLHYPYSVIIIRINDFAAFFVQYEPLIISHKNRKLVTKLFRILDKIRILMSFSLSCNSLRDAEE